MNWKSIITGLAAAVTLTAAGAYGQFQPTTSLPEALLAHSAVDLNGRIYVSGGVGNLNQNNYLNDVYYCAQILPDGQLGPWQTASSMPQTQGLGLHASLAHDGRLYVLGGTNIYGARNEIYFSNVNQDGTLSAWTLTARLPTRMFAHSVADYGGRFYLTGGLDRFSDPLGAVYSAQVNADGTLGAWRAETPLPVPLFGHRSFARGGKLFVLGGFSGPGGLYGPGGAPAAGLSGAVYAADINPDGTLGAWQAQPPLPTGLAFYGMAVSDKSVYLLGGFNGGTSNAVYFAPFTAAGGLGSWVPLQALPKGLLALAAVSDGEYLYSMGGAQSYLDDPVADIYFSRLKTELSAFVELTPTTINTRANGKWVTVIIGLPEADASAIVPSSVRISAINGAAVAPIAPDPKWTAKLYTGDSTDFSGLDGVSYVMLKFSRQAVADIVPAGDFSIKLEGSLSDGRAFSGESMNRGLRSDKLFTEVTEKRAGTRRTPEGVRVDIPPGAFNGNPDLLLTAEPEEEGDSTPAEKARRAAGLKTGGLAAVSKPFEFGPHGMVFLKPITVSLPYTAAALPAGTAESSLRIGYWNPDSGAWEILPSTVSKADGLVTAQVAHFSLYQVLSEAAPASAPTPIPSSGQFSLGEVYVYPDPAVPGRPPKLHVAVSSGDRASVKIYSTSGRLVHETSVSGAPGTFNGESAYELDLGGDFTSGIYYYSAEVDNGAQKLHRSGKFAVVR